MTSNTSSPRLFGTDGIRGTYGEGWLTAERVARLGRTIGQVLGNGATGRALLGHDGRRSGPILEAALARGLGETGVEVTSAGLITTPALALEGLRQSFDLTVMISASHNPARDNGIKVFGQEGKKIADEVEREIERRVHAELEAEGAAAIPSATDELPSLPHEPAIESAYLEHLSQAFASLKLGGVNVVIDCANGGGSRLGPRILGRLGAQVTALAAEPDGDNINAGCGSTHPEGLQDQVRRESAHIGIALDGDGDRCMLVDERGVLVNGDGILTILGRHAAQRGAWEDPRIVATVMSNKGLHRALRDVGVGVVTVGVGDRNVVEAMRAEGLELGGEQSGHVICGAEHSFLGDGIYTALRVLQAMAEAQAPLSELAAPYVEFPQVLINVPVAEKPDFGELPAVTARVASIEETLGDDGRVLLRYSGTEPLARVMVEGPDEGWIRESAQEVADLIAREIGG